MSDSNRIVLKYDEPELHLIGGISHNDYALFAQDYLDFIGNKYSLKRPEVFKFNSIQDMLEMVKKWEGKEGIVLYSDNGQTLHKIKADKYILLHSLRSEFSSIENLIDLFISQGYPKYEDFFLNICNMADYEIATNYRADISKICDAFKEVKEIEEDIEKFVSKLAGLTRKEQAVKILSSFDKEKVSFVFTKLDRKSFGDMIYKKLILLIINEK